MPRPKKKTIVLCPGGANQREVPIDSIQIPDLWHLHVRLAREGRQDESKMVVETWKLAHDLLTHIKNDGLVAHTKSAG